LNDQLAIAAELIREVARMERGDKRFVRQPSPGGYQRELSLAGLAGKMTLPEKFRPKVCR
jgi:hypothetical protein